MHGAENVPCVGARCVPRGSDKLVCRLHKALRKVEEVSSVLSLGYGRLLSSFRYSRREFEEDASKLRADDVVHRNFILRHTEFRAAVRGIRRTIASRISLYGEKYC